MNLPLKEVMAHKKEKIKTWIGGAMKRNTICKHVGETNRKIHIIAVFSENIEDKPIHQIKPMCSGQKESIIETLP